MTPIWDTIDAAPTWAVLAGLAVAAVLA